MLTQSLLTKCLIKNVCRYGTFATGGCDGYVNVWDGNNKKRLYQVLFLFALHNLSDQNFRKVIDSVTKLLFSLLVLKISN